MKMQLSAGVKITKVEELTANGTSAIESASVDMSGYEGVLFITNIITAAANNTIKASQSSDDSTFADLLGTSVASGTSDEVCWLDILHPTDRYVRCEVARGTSTVVSEIYAIQYGAHKQPVDNTTTGTIAGEAHVSPAEGTA
jgi:hypothetical protein